MMSIKMKSVLYYSLLFLCSACQTSPTEHGQNIIRSESNASQTKIKNPEKIWSCVYEKQNEWEKKRTQGYVAGLISAFATQKSEGSHDFPGEVPSSAVLWNQCEQEMKDIL